MLYLLFRINTLLVQIDTRRQLISQITSYANYTNISCIMYVVPIDTSVCETKCQRISPYSAVFIFSHLIQLVLLFGQCKYFQHVSFFSFSVRNPSQEARFHCSQRTGVILKASIPCTTISFYLLQASTAGIGTALNFKMYRQPCNIDIAHTERYSSTEIICEVFRLQIPGMSKASRSNQTFKIGYI